MPVEAPGALRILQVSTADIAGGAEKVAWELFRSYRARGYASWLAVGRKASADADVLVIPNTASRGRCRQALLAGSRRLQPLADQVRGGYRLQQAMRWAADPVGEWERYTGREAFDFPGSRRLLELPPQPPALLHCHNLHGGYFDLRVLPRLSAALPVVLTLHDAWLLSGHCAHSFGCQRWQTGCGSCPDLDIYPAIRRDATADNWRRKREIFRRSRLWVATPSRWLMEKVERSMLAPAASERRVIPYGVDTALFRPGPREAARQQLGIPPQARVLLFTANGIRRNPWKDYQTLREAIQRVAQTPAGENVWFIALGEDAPEESIGRARVRFIPYEKNPERVAGFYQAADIYVHAARIDTFPNTVLEALACGTPVVATAVGGIPEQVMEGETGFLTPPGDAAAMALRIQQLLADVQGRQAMGQRAAADARRRFDLTRQVDAYLAWYQEILGRHRE